MPDSVGRSVNGRASHRDHAAGRIPCARTGTGITSSAAPPAELLGTISNVRGTVPPNVSKALTSNVFGTGDPRPSDLAGDESRAYERLSILFTKGIGHALENHQLEHVRTRLTAGLLCHTPAPWGAGNMFNTRWRTRLATLKPLEARADGDAGTPFEVSP